MFDLFTASKFHRIGKNTSGQPKAGRAAALGSRKIEFSAGNNQEDGRGGANSATIDGTVG